MKFDQLKHLSLALMAVVAATSACSEKKKSSNSVQEAEPVKPPTDSDINKQPSDEANSKCKSSSSESLSDDDFSDDSEASLAESSTATKSKTASKDDDEEDKSSDSEECEDEIKDVEKPAEEVDTPDVKVKADCAKDGKPILFRTPTETPICHEGVKLVNKGSDWCVDAASIKVRFQKAPYLAGNAIEPAYKSYTTEGTAENQGYVLDQCGEFADGKPVIYLVKKSKNAEGIEVPVQKRLSAEVPKSK